MTWTLGRGHRGTCPLALLLAVLIPQVPAGAQIPDDIRLRPLPHAEKVTVCEAASRRFREVREVLAESRATATEQGWVVANASFARDHNLLIVDDGTREVWVAGRDLKPIRRIGRSGSGPGEYQRPLDAAQGVDGRIYVLDRGHGMSRLLIYDSLGAALEETTLPLAGTRLAVGTSSVFVSAPVVMLQVASQGRVPILAEYDIHSRRALVLLRSDASWRHRAPLYTIPLSQTIPRIGADGRLYLAWQQGYEIWRVDGLDTYSVVVKGCLPEGALKEYRRDEVQGHRSFLFIADFVVLADGHPLVRTGLTDGEKRRIWEVYGSDGRLLVSWALGSPELHHQGLAINPARPNEHLTWLRSEGVTRLLQLSGAATGHGPGSGWAPGGG